MAEQRANGFCKTWRDDVFEFAGGIFNFTSANAKNVHNDAFGEAMSPDKIRCFAFTFRREHEFIAASQNVTRRFHISQDAIGDIHAIALGEIV